MKAIIRRWIVSLLAFLLIFSSLAWTAADRTAAAESLHELEDGIYPVSYRYLKDNTADTSVADGFLKVKGQDQGSLIVENGNIWFEHAVDAKQYAYFAYIGSRKAGFDKARIDLNPMTGQYTVTGLEGYEPFTISEAGEDLLRVRVAIEDIMQDQDILMHVVIKDDPVYGKDFVYDHWYNVQLTWDREWLKEPEGPAPLEQLNELISVTRSVYETTYEGTNFGQYPEGSKQELYQYILFAESVRDSQAGNEVLVLEALKELEAAITRYRASVYEADKRELRELLSKAATFLSLAKPEGETEGRMNIYFPPITVGEYGRLDTLISRYNSVQRVADNPAATQAAVNSQYLNLLSALERVDQSRYAADPVKIYILDTDQETSEQSRYAGDLEDTATILSPAGGYRGGRFVANLAFVKTEGLAEEVFQSRAIVVAPGYELTEPGQTDERDMAHLIHQLSAEDRKVYQTTIRYVNSSDEYWAGLSYLRYSIDGETREVYISYNADKLEKLRQTLELAGRLYNEAAPVNGSESAYEEAKPLLKQAMEQVEPTARNLAATLQQITAAQAELDAALTAFQVTVAYERYYSVAHATEDVFSAAGSYLGKPARIETNDDGTANVFLTIRDASAVKELQIRQGEQYVTAQVVSEDSSENSRLVMLPVHDLSVLQEVRVRIAAPEGNEENDVVYEVRLNFNHVDNASLQAAWIQAEELYRTSEAGSLPGQYPQSAMDQLQAALAEAGNAAADTAGTAQQSASLLEMLQEAVAAFKASVVKEAGLEDGQYTIDFTILKNGTDEPSMMDGYVVKPAVLSVKEGTLEAAFTLKQSKQITHLKVSGQDVIVKSENAEANTRVVAFPVSDLSAKLDAWVSIHWPELNYTNREYDIQIVFDKSTMVPAGPNPEEPNPEEPTTEELLALFQSGIDMVQKLHDRTTVGNFAGRYPQEAKTELAQAIEQARVEAARTDATRQQIEVAQEALLQSLTVFLKSKNWGRGTYTVRTGYVGGDFGDYVTSGKLVTASDGSARLTLRPKAEVSITELVHVESGERIYPNGSDSGNDSAESSAGKQAEFNLDDVSAFWMIVLTEEVNGERQELRFLTHLALITGEIVKSDSNSSSGYNSPAPANSAESVDAKDGNYYIDFRILKDGTEDTSMMQEYVVSPALIKAENGKLNVYFTLKQSKEITGLRWNGNDVRVLSEDPATNTRIVYFEVADLAAKQNGWVKIEWAEMNYFNEYSIQLTFDASSMRKAEDDAKVPGIATTDDHSDNEQRGEAEEWITIGLTDIDGHWAQTNIGRAVVLGIANGYADGSFRPDGYITRGEFAALLSRALKPDADIAVETFSDAQDIPEWAIDPVSRVAAAGWMNGYADGSFRADQTITRAELTVIIARAAGLELHEGAMPSFADTVSIPDWARKEAAAAAQAGLVGGKQHNRFDSAAKATRAEALTFIMRLLDALAGEEAGA